MEYLYIAPSVSTPEIIFEPKDQALYFMGQSYPSDSVTFYAPVFAWLDKVLSGEDLRNGFNVVFKLKYYNTSTSKQIARFFKILEDSKFRNEIQIRWYYYDYDTDMLEAGQRFSTLTLLKFEIKEYCIV